MPNRQWEFKVPAFVIACGETYEEALEDLKYLANQASDKTGCQVNLDENAPMVVKYRDMDEDGEPIGEDEGWKPWFLHQPRT